jgi:hypothetical protein
MRDPAVNAAAAEARRAKDAIETARQRLYWTLLSVRRWADSRWSGQDPRDDWEEGFRHAVAVARQIINDPASDRLLRKYAPFVPVSEARKAIIAALERARTRPRKKGELREQMNALRDQWIAEAVALTCKDGFYVHRGSATKDRERRESACSIVAKALRDLGFRRLSEERVEAIWDKYKETYSHLAVSSSGDETDT